MTRRDRTRRAAPARRRWTWRWRWLETPALLATIPAFYLAMLSSHRGVSVLAYLAAAAASGGVAWADAAAPLLAGPRAARRARLPLGAALAVALLVAAALPEGDAPALLIPRLAAAALIVMRLGETTLPSTWGHGLPRLLALGLGVLGCCGLGFWWLEPTAHTLGDGLWLAFTTAATVGYGDILPTTPASKIFAVFVVLTGFAVLSLVTASIAAFWVQTEERRIEHEILRDLHRELRAVRAELAEMRRDARQPDAAPPQPLTAAALPDA